EHDPSRIRGGAAPPPKEFDATTADETDLVGYGLPLRPNPHTQPGLAALWERQARRYRHFDHLAVEVPRSLLDRPTSGRAPLDLTERETCGYSLNSFDSPLTALFVTWTVPNLRYTENPRGPNTLHTFVSLGFLDVHVEMTVDEAQDVTVRFGGTYLAVRPGEVRSAAICLAPEPPGRATFVLANETRSQTANFSFDTGFPPAVSISAGLSRGNPEDPFNPLARFGI